MSKIKIRFMILVIKMLGYICLQVRGPYHNSILEKQVDELTVDLEIEFEKE